MDLGVEGRVAVVLGAGSGLGRAIALEFAAEGAAVACVGRRQLTVDQTAAMITEAGGRALAVEWDLADLDSVEAVVRQIEDGLGSVEILVNNTGGPPPTTAHGQSAALWRKHFDSMVLSVLALTDRVLPGMRAAGWGRIVTSVSSGVATPIPNLGLSNTLRSTLVGWSKTLSREVAADGITVNLVVPGRIATDRTRQLDVARAEREHTTVEEVAAASAASIPVGRYGTPAEYGRVVTFLGSAAASYITGSAIRVDGGMIPSV